MVLPGHTMKTVWLSIMALILFFCASAQNDTAYIYSYGGIWSDNFSAIQPSADGGYIMIGTSNSFGCGNTDMYVVKTDSLCRHVWSRTYGGYVNEEGYSVATTYDHGFAFLGFTDSYGNGGYDVFLVRTDSVGNIKWEKTYGGSDWDFGYSIKETPADSGFIICGTTYSYGKGNGDVYVIKTNKFGDTLWTKAIGGSGYDAGNSVCLVNDSLYAIAGETSSFGKGDTDVYVMLLNEKGDVKRDTTYGSLNNDVGYSINPTNDGGLVIFGSSDSIQSGKPDELFIKTNSNGVIQWMNIFHSAGVGIGYYALQAPDSSYLAVSTTNSYGNGGFSMRIWQFNSSGVPLSGPSYGGVGDEYGTSIAIGKNGNVVFVGSTNSTGYTVGLSDAYAVRLKKDSVFNVTNYYSFPYTMYKDTCTCILGIKQNTAISPAVKVFPNPMNSNATILIQSEIGDAYSFSLYNSLGVTIISKMELYSNGHGQYCGHINRGYLIDGVYPYNIYNRTAQLVYSSKIIIK